LIDHDVRDKGNGFGLLVAEKNEVVRQNEKNNRLEGITDLNPGGGFPSLETGDW